METNKPDIIIPDPINQLNKKYEIIIFVIIGIFIVAIATLIFMAITLLIDARHFNSATYKEYSEKMQTVDGTLKINQELLNQNKENQNIIIELQKKLLIKK